jgi:hypothetical protein
MPIDYESTHPDFDKFCVDLETIRDADEGETVVKRQTSKYLPVTSGQAALGLNTNPSGTKKPGQLLYDAYLARAVFPEIVRATSEALVGVMLREPWLIKVPDSMQPVLDAITNRGEAVDDLVDQMLQTVLKFGRIGLLAEVNEATKLPFLVPYEALEIRNWNDEPEGVSSTRDLRFVLLDESGSRMDPATLQWDERKRFRAVSLSDTGNYLVRVQDQSGTGGVIEEEIEPQLQGKSFEGIPFTFVNATDLTTRIGNIPLLPLSRLAMTIYRGEADYRHALFMTGQDTLVISGVSNPGITETETINSAGEPTGSNTVIGAGAVIYLPSPEADAKFIGVSGTGLSEMRSSLENDYDRAEQFGLTLLTSGAGAEAAQTIATRVRARTASLVQIVKTSAQGLKSALEDLQQWMGVSGEIEVEPSLDFVENPIAPQEFLSLVQAKLAGAPLAWRTLHDLAEQRGLTDRNWEEELEALLEDAVVEPDPVDDPNAGEPDDDEEEEDQPAA